MVGHQNISQTCVYPVKTADYGQLSEATSRFMVAISNLPQEHFQSLNRATITLSQLSYDKLVHMRPSAAN